ncbi:MAG TPA: alpha/beta hydrolase [Streptosporangiaceae bacterium]
METSYVVTAGGVRIAYAVTGAAGAPPLVALHALGERGADWEQVAGQLAAHYRVYAPDLRGHGDSDWPGDYSPRLMRDDVLGFMDELNLPVVSLLGHSLGGVVALLIAMSQQGRIERLIVEDVTPPYDRDPPPLPARPQEPAGFDWDMLAPIRAQASVRDDAAWAGLGSITVPALLVGGGPGSHIPQELLAQAAAAMPDCTLVTIPAGHNVHRGRPAEFAGTVLGWLRAERAVS